MFSESDVPNGHQHDALAQLATREGHVGYPRIAYQHNPQEDVGEALLEVFRRLGGEAFDRYLVSGVKREELIRQLTELAEGFPDPDRGTLKVELMLAVLRHESTAQIMNTLGIRAAVQQKTAGRIPAVTNEALDVEVSEVVNSVLVDRGERLREMLLQRIATKS